MSDVMVELDIHAAPVPRIDGGNRAHQNDGVQRERPVIDVVEIEANPVVEAERCCGR